MLFRSVQYRKVQSSVISAVHLKTASPPVPSTNRRPAQWLAPHARPRWSRVRAPATPFLPHLHAREAGPTCQGQWVPPRPLHAPVAHAWHLGPHASAPGLAGAVCKMPSQI